MRKLVILLFCFFAIQCCGQFPYVKKLSYPEQLPTQVVYDMLTDAKGYIWIGTDKGLYRFNGRTFISIPFNVSTSNAVSYLQQDSDGVIWCMNFYNQLFYYRNDTLRRFEFDNSNIRNATTFSNVIIGRTKIWFHSFSNVYEIDKLTRKIRVFNYPTKTDIIFSTCISNDKLYAFTNSGYIFTAEGEKSGWYNSGQTYRNLRLIGNGTGAVGLGIGLERKAPFQIENGNCTLLKPLNLPAGTYITHGVYMNNGEYWLCASNGAYLWNKETGETKCYLPNQRVSDVIMDYQGNYWFSTLDNGIFLCSSLNNTLLKVYNDPFLDNFTKLESLPNGEIVAGNTQGLLSKINLDNHETFRYHLDRWTEIAFINYIPEDNVIICNRGVFRPDQKDPIDRIDYSKGVSRDKFGNIITAIYNAAFVMNNHYGSMNRFPATCPLYKANNAGKGYYDSYHSLLILRLKRSIAVLASRNQESFWIAYEDGLYEYHYDGRITVLTDQDRKPVIGQSMLQLPDSSLAVGTSTKGIMIFRNGKIVRGYDVKNGLSSANVRKIIEQDGYIWVLTDAGLDRVDRVNGTVTNYLEEYGLSNIIINDFNIRNDRILFATPTGILQRFNTPKNAGYIIKFPLLRAVSNGLEVKDHTSLPNKNRDIVLHFEALHFLSANALSYQYRLKGIDTVWRTVNSFTNQLAFNRLSPGKYSFEIQAVAGANYKSALRIFSFNVTAPYWQRPLAWVGALMVLLVIGWFSLGKWKAQLIKRQSVREQLLKSQLTALRAQMNPHFLYNVLNTVQGLVYGNRKTEAGALLGNFSDLMRKILQSSDKQLLPLADEIENLTLYLELEKARFDEGFSYSIEMNHIDDLSTIRIPSLLIQPFAENAVKHGLLHKKGVKHLAIIFEKVASGLLVTINDNGIGRHHAGEINRRTKNKPSGFATAALNERMELFNRLYKQKISCSVIDKKTEDNQPAGTQVRLVIPDYTIIADAL